MLLDIVLTLFGGGGRGGFVSNRRLLRKQNGNTPMNNGKQKEQIDAIANMLGLNKEQRRKLHDAISGQGLGFQEILELARDMFRN